VPGLADALSLPPIWREGRTPLEAAALFRDPVWRGNGVPRGDGGPVLLVCGFLAGDNSLGLMARWLKRIGHGPVRAGIRWNVGCTGAAVDRLEERLELTAERHGAPVAIVGQSRGGCMARALGVRRPDLVDRVVTLGAPLLDPLDVHPAVWAQVHAFGLLGSLGVPGLFTSGCRAGPCCATANAAMTAPLADGVQLTTIYSRSDGIVGWRSCVDPQAEQVEVRASHIGMAAHPAVYRAVARAIAPAGAVAP
jgi:pimeloyl-ACP methyl ester carboxylesterase